MYMFPAYDLYFMAYMFGNVFIVQGVVASIINYAVTRVEKPARRLAATRSR